MKIRLGKTGRVWAHGASVPAAMQERAASKQRRLDPLVRCPARSRSHGPSSFPKNFRFIWLLHTPLQSKLFKTKFVSEMTTNLTSSGQYHLWKQCPTPRVAMSPWHLSTSIWLKGVLEGEIPTNSDLGMAIFEKKSLPQGPFLGYCFHFTCALLGMKWWCWHFVLNRCIGCIWLQAWAFPLWKIRLCFKAPHSETLLIHFSRYSCWCKQNRWSLNHKDMALRRKGGVTHGRQPAPLDIKRGSPLRPVPRVLLCPLTIPFTTFTIVHRIGCSRNLNISYHCSAVSWEYR